MSSADWEEVKDRVMYRAVYAKFSQHPELAQVLLSTRGQALVERAADRYWGDGLQWRWRQ